MRSEATREQHQALIVIQALTQLPNGNLVAGGWEIEVGIWNRAKRSAAQPEAAMIHGAAFLPD